MMGRIHAILTKLRAFVGREPALLLQLVGTIVALAGAYAVHLTVDQQGALNGLAATIVGILTWRVTRDGTPALILGLLKAAVVVGLAWHLHISAENQALLYSAASALLGMFVRTQVTAPVPAPTVIDGEVVPTTAAPEPVAPPDVVSPAATG